MLRPNIVSVVPEDGHCLLLEYETGEKKRFDATPYLFGDFYGRLLDPEYFKKVRIEYGGWFVGWPEGQDMPPEALYDDGIPVEA